MPAPDPQLSIVPPRLGSRVLELIGNTPLLRVRLFEEELPGVRVFAKAEYRNPGGSVKDRPALRMITEAERRGLLTPERRILDATSGNTGVAYAMIGAARGYGVHLVMPANVSAERRALVHAFGAEVTFSDPMEGSDGAIRLCREILAASPDRYYMPDQYNNPENWRAHYHGTAAEIWEQTGGSVTHFVAALGTAGTFVGTGRRLRELNPQIRLYSVQPESPWHGLEGLKHMESAIVPGIYDPNLADRDLGVPTEEAYDLARRLASTEGILVGHSSGANLWGVREVAREIEQGVVVTIFCDGGDRYLSTGLYGLTPSLSVGSVRLSGPAEAAIRRLAAAAHPHEGCGVLIGGYEPAAVAVQEATSGRNLWTERLRDRYDLDPADIQAADRGARARGLDVVGFWHSHPDHPARPSQFDSDRAWAGYAYLIVTSVAGGSGDLNAFTLEVEGEGLRQVGLALEAGAP